MKCDSCNNKEATVHLTEIINNKVTKLHLCEECARKKSHQMEEHFGLADLLSGLADIASPMEKIENVREKKIKCPTCGFTFYNFRKMGRLGCPKCYVTFEKQLSPLFKKIHGSDVHVGKMIKTKEVVRDKTTLVSELKSKLTKAIQLEEFEEAARLRDQLRALARKGNKK